MTANEEANCFFFLVGLMRTLETRSNALGGLIYDNISRATFEYYAGGWWSIDGDGPPPRRPSLKTLTALAEACQLDLPELLRRVKEEGDEYRGRKKPDLPDVEGYPV